MKNFSIEAHTVGKLMLLIGLIVLFPLIVLTAYPEEMRYASCFLIPAFLSIASASILILFKKHRAPAYLSRRDSAGYSGLIVLFTWGWGVVIGAAPFFISGQLSAVQSVFEAVSGFTTTGLSVMDVSKTPAIFLFHRSFMQYCGGLGFIMMMIFFAANRHSTILYRAEGHPDKIEATIRKTAASIVAIYLASLAAGTILYRLAGMSFFDGINHAMCSLSTGGFSTKLDSIGAFHSLPVEFITIALMLIGTTNFAALLLLARGNIRSFFKISEVRFLILLLAVAIPVVAFSLSSELGMGLSEGFRRASVDLISALSTTGYSTMSYSHWPDLAVAMLLLLMLIGGGIGSTAGGMKLERIYLLFRFVKTTIRRKLNTRNHMFADTYVRAQGDVSIDEALREDTTSFIALYLSVFTLGSLLLVASSGASLTEAMFEFASSLGTVGLSMGVTSPSASNLTLFIEIAGMLLGRLELFIVMIGLSFGWKQIRRRLRR
ncbi:MAG: potassium transporter TrkG [Peptoniphilus sp.]|nr:potassium transporter TrkG [Peptoniphilus sp.]MDD7363454.1 potassium transporter TrkG [Bacillota bacterium]MDY6044842.1 potassium transporter TrkG [Peptoniphilus sp.]